MVAHLLPKQVVAGSSPVSRSKDESHTAHAVWLLLWGKNTFNAEVPRMRDAERTIAPFSLCGFAALR